MRGKATKFLRGALAVVLASCLCLPTSALAANEVEEGRGADGADDGRTDVTESWVLGVARIETGGAYVLSGDVSAEAPLVIALPEGESAIFDLAGHGVTVGGSATCAVDLSENKGDVAFVDSTRDADVADGAEGVDDAGGADDGRPRASLALEVENPSEDVSLIACVRTSPAREASPSASFEGLRLSVEASEKTVESYERAVAIAKTGIASGDDEQWKAEDETVSLAFRDCDFVTEVHLPDDAQVIELIEATGAAQGAASVVDAGCRGVELGGRIAASVEVDGEGSGAPAPTAFVSAFDSSYVIDGDIEAVDVADEAESLVAGEQTGAEGAEHGSDGEADYGEPEGAEEDGKDDAPTLVFGYPSGLAADDSGEAIVAVPASDGEIPEKVAEFLAAAEGFEAEFDRASDDAEGFSAMRLVEADDGDADGEAAQSIEEVDDGEDGSERPEADEPESDEASKPADDVAVDEVDGDANVVAAASAGSDVRESSAAVVPAASVERAAEVVADAPAAGSGGSQAATGAYAHYVAEHPGELVYAADIAATNGTDLNAAWKKQEGGLASPYSITTGGTYYLSANLTATNNLIVNAPGKNVTLKLNGHVLAVACVGDAESPRMVQITDAKSVTIDGGGGTVRNSSQGAVWGISAVASGCALDIKNTTVSLAPASVTQRTLDTHAVRVEDGTLTMSDCTVNLDLGNQTLCSTGSIKLLNNIPPSAIYVTAKETSATLTNCTVNAIGSPCFALSDVNDKASIGNIYALYARSTTTVNGGAYKAESQKGNAACLYGNKLTVSGLQVALEANAGQIASGAMTDVTGGIVLGAPLSFSVGDDFAGVAEVETALRTRVANGFTFGACAPSGSVKYSALAMMEGDGLTAANASGYALGSFASSLSGSNRANVLSALANALGTGCSLVAHGSSVQFTFDSSSEIGAVACVNNTTYYPTLASALKASAFTEGSTLKLLRDFDSVVVASTKSGTLDLNGHTIGSFKFSASSGGTGFTVKNGKVNGSQSVSGGAAAVSHASASPLTLSDVDIEMLTTDKTVFGVHAASNAGALVIDGSTTIDLVASQAISSCTAYGIYALSSSSGLSVADAKIGVSAASAGVALYGISAVGSVTVADSEIAASGTTATTGAIYTAKSLGIKRSSLVVHTTEASSSAYGFGIWCGSSDASTGVSIEGCTVSVTSDANIAGCAYTCLLGSRYSSASSVAPWSLSGENVFVGPISNGGTHMGYNIGQLIVSKDFRLGSGSDSKLVVSQAEQDGDVGVKVDGNPTSAELATLAGLFQPADDSHYEGWKLVAGGDGGSLTWRSEGDSGAGIVSVIHGGAVSNHASFASAIAAAESGDTVKLLGDLPESGSVVISQDDLTIDLDGKELVMRAGVAAAGGSDETGGAVSYTGSGTLSIAGAGTLEIDVGAAAEASGSSATVYQGIAVSGGGMLDVGAGTTVAVRYTGGTSPSAVQTTLSMRGISVLKGALNLAGVLTASGLETPGAPGSQVTYGVYVAPAAGVEANATVAASGSISVRNDTATSTNSSFCYSDTLAAATGNSAHIVALREITVDPETDAQFYGDLVERFRETAVYDNPDSAAGSSNLQLSIYDSLGMTMYRDGAWYDGLRVWAFTDEVAAADVGKMSAIVPTHVFVPASIDTPPESYGIATPSSAAGKAAVSVSGSVSAACSDGNASAVSAQAAGGSDVQWTCDGSNLSARAGNATHLIGQGDFDLGNVVTLSSPHSGKLAYTTLQSVSLVDYEADSARGVIVGDNVSVTLDGSMSFRASGTDAAAIEVPEKGSFATGGGFSLAAGSDACSIANASGDNIQDVTFAKGAADASLFEDAYGKHLAGAVSDGIAWTAASGADVVDFMVGAAVVKRYVAPSSDIDLSEPSAFGAQASGLRNAQTLVGWSLGADENATSGYLGTNDSVTPSGNATYHAVYSTGMVGIGIAFTNVRDATGNLADDSAFGIAAGTMTLAASYCDTVASALDAAGKTLPTPQDYTEGGVDYRFIGWHPYIDSNPTSAQVYGAGKVGDLELTMGVNGVSSGTLTLRATYVAVRAGQHLVSFIVDGRVSACAIDDGAIPSYIVANGSSTTSTLPSKVDTQTGTTFTFAGWYVDADGDGARGDSEALYTSALPQLLADAAYVADWASQASAITFKAVYIYYSQDSKTGVTTFTKDAVKVAEGTFGDSFQKLADTVGEIGSKITYGGKVYTLLGWSPRSNDVEPVYDADNPLPAAVKSNGEMISNATSMTCYAVYSTADHRVNVAFFNGAAKLGTARNVTTADTSINAAFAKSGATRPADKSATNKFKGWAISSTATKALSGSSTMIWTLVSASTKTLNLYAVYNSAVSFPVYLRNEDGTKIWYSVKAREGKTVASVFEAANKPITSASTFNSVGLKKNRFFAGWYTATDEFYGLNTEVTGTVNGYAKYRDMTVKTPDAASISADIKPGGDLLPLGVTKEMSNLTLSFARESMPFPSIGSQVAKDGYAVLSSYLMSLEASYVDGSTAEADGDIGVMQVKLYVGTKYAGARIGVYWLGKNKALSEVKSSLGKSVDGDGYVTVNIGNFMAMDAGEGGTLVIASKDATSGKVDLDPDDDGESPKPKDDENGKDNGKSKGKDKAKNDSNDSDNTDDGSPAIASDGGISGGGGSSLGLGGMSSGLGLGGSSSDLGGLPSGLSLMDGDAAAEALAEAQEEAAEEEDSFFKDWDSNAVVLVALVLIALAAMFYGLWRLVVVRQRREEAEAELPSFDDKYAKGLTF